MIATVRHLTHPTVAPTGAADALAWLARQRAWELRLAELERHGSPEREPRYQAARHGLARSA